MAFAFASRRARFRHSSRTTTRTRTRRPCLPGTPTSPRCRTTPCWCVSFLFLLAGILLLLSSSCPAALRTPLSCSLPASVSAVPLATAVSSARFATHSGSCVVCLIAANHDGPDDDRLLGADDQPERGSLPELLRCVHAVVCVAVCSLLLPRARYVARLRPIATDRLRPCG